MPSVIDPQPINLFNLLLCFSEICFDKFFQYYKIFNFIYNKAFKIKVTERLFNSKIEKLFNFINRKNISNKKELFNLKENKEIKRINYYISSYDYLLILIKK